MKSIKPGATHDSPARKAATPRARKPIKGKARAVDPDMPPPAVPSKALAKARAESVQQPSSETPRKRKKPVAREDNDKPTAKPRIIACHLCGATDVPLLLGGRKLLFYVGLERITDHHCRVLSCLY